MKLALSNNDEEAFFYIIFFYDEACLLTANMIMKLVFSSKLIKIEGAHIKNKIVYLILINLDFKFNFVQNIYS